jgi:pilus assembly protein CpaC
MRKDDIMSMTTEPRTDGVLLRQTLRFSVIAALLGALFGLAPVGFGIARAGETTHLQVSKASYGSTQPISLGINKSLILDLPANVGEVIVSQPEVAAAVMRSKNRAVIRGVAAGDTNIFFLDASGRTISVLDIEVFKQRSDVGSSLEASLARIIPGSAIRVESVILEGANRVVLSGSVASQDDAERAIAIAVQFAGDPANVASIIDIAGSQQVMLKVTVAEVNREAVKQLGINLNGTATIGSATLGLNNNPALGGASNVITGNGVSAGVAVPGFSLEATLQALERRSALRTLAEPNLTAMSGQEAEFLAGGEFPVPTEVADDGTVTYTFKEFGVRLKFTPTVKSNGVIGLVVDTSVTEPTTEGGFSAGGGLTIQATKRRQARTTVELAGGETLAIAGLIQDSVRQQINKLPGLGDIPILGALFRSRDFIHAQTELVILVTPYLAYPGDTPHLPTDDMVIASDAEAIFLGRMEKMYGVGPDGMRGSYDGSVGFVLD